ncbi:hypothetical protein NEMBOFW57_007089 [Staphylotrichum longicolle]|uniref:F-box domain-containing protein n=1 Tax=Staphylotrichum longicolle TaxID=669026 RepID=A0AAD4EU69_9PEZI|nr:hypothetical protein NEMBOFW57_007089 [Staphylotrichum longicolle]
MDSHPDLDSVPNELLISILSQLPTPSLLPLVTVSHRFYAATLQVLKLRLHHALAEPDHRLMLDFAGVEAEAEGSLPGAHEAAHSGGLRAIYSHFRPVEHDDNAPQRARVSRRRQSSIGTSGTSGGGQRSVVERPSIDVYLDDDESFSQLCATTNLVRLGPKPGLFRSHVNVSDGVVRVWREWLAARASEKAGEAATATDEVVLWVDAARDVGVRFRVTEKDIRAQHPVLVGNDEQLPVAYRLEFEELLVRSSTLLVMVEKSEVQEVVAEGKAIVLASF